MPSRRTFSLSALALALALPLLLTIPLGCAGQPAENPADTAGNAAGGGDAAGDAAGSLVGDDPSLGDTLGPWPGGWDTLSLAVGQHFRYDVKTYDQAEGVQEGTLEIGIKDADEGQFIIEWRLELPGVDLNYYFGTNPGWIDWRLGVGPEGWNWLRELVQDPAEAYDGSGLVGWEDGSSSAGAGAGRITCTIEGRRSFAGITGALGRWERGDGSSGTFCANPRVALPLYVHAGGADCYTEFTLVEAGGF